MKLQTIIKRMHHYLPASEFDCVDGEPAAEPAMPDYLVDPQVGDLVEWRHNWGGRSITLQGTVLRLLEPREDWTQYRPEGVKRKRWWRESKNYQNRRRVIVEVPQAPGEQSLYLHRVVLEACLESFQNRQTERGG